MRVAFLLFVHLLGSVAKLFGPGGSKGLLAETLLVKHQLIVLNRSRRRTPNLSWNHSRNTAVGCANCRVARDASALHERFTRSAYGFPTHCRRASDRVRKGSGHDGSLKLCLTRPMVL